MAITDRIRIGTYRALPSGRSACEAASAQEVPVYGLVHRGELEWIVVPALEGRTSEGSMRLFPWDVAQQVVRARDTGCWNLDPSRARVCYNSQGRPVVLLQTAGE